MTKDEYRVLGEKVDTLQKGQDRIDRDLSEDRKYIQEFVIRLGNLETKINELLKGQHTAANRVKDVVEDAVEPMIEEAKDLKEVIEEKKIIAFKPKKFFFFWKK